MKRVWLMGTLVLLLSVFSVVGGALAGTDSDLPRGLAERCAEAASSVPCSKVPFSLDQGDGSDDGGTASTMGAEGPGPWIK